MPLELEFSIIEPKWDWSQVNRPLALHRRSGKVSLWSVNDSNSNWSWVKNTGNEKWEYCSQSVWWFLNDVRRNRWIDGQENLLGFTNTWAFLSAKTHRTQNNHLWYTIKATWVPEKIYFDDEKIYFDDEKIYFDDEK